MPVDENDSTAGPDGQLHDNELYLVLWLAGRFLCDQDQDQELNVFLPRHDPFYHARNFPTGAGAPDKTWAANLDGHFPQTTGTARLCLHGWQAECGT